MGRFLLKRLGLAIVTLVLLSIIAFAAAQLLPGNVGRNVLGGFATQQSVDLFNHQHGVYGPVYSQYGRWIGHLLHGNLGDQLVGRAEPLAQDLDESRPGVGLPLQELQDVAAVEHRQIARRHGTRIGGTFSAVEQIDLAEHCARLNDAQNDLPALGRADADPHRAAEHGHHGLTRVSHEKDGLTRSILPQARPGHERIALARDQSAEQHGFREQPPRIFRVNWFRRDAQGKFIWPGFGENMRVLQWVVDRCQGRARGVEETSLGLMPRYEDLNWTGLEKLSAARYAELAWVDPTAWRDELASHDELFAKLGKRLPAALEARRGNMHQKLAA